MKRILFIDTRNAARSQMAEAWLNHLGGPTVQASSCGTMPAQHIDQRAVQVMREMGIALAKKFPKPVTQQRMNWADVIVVFGTGLYPRALCPTYVWDIPDLTGKSIDQVRALRNQIRAKVATLLIEIQNTQTEPLNAGSPYPAWQLV